MLNHKLAAKAFIEKNGKFLLVKREKNNVQAPGIWEIPGGRLKEGEIPVEGLKREVKEETGIIVKAVMPFSTRHFTRSDGQIVDLIIYYAKAQKGKVKLSTEHAEYIWANWGELKKKINPFFKQETETIEKIKKGTIFK